VNFDKVKQLIEVEKIFERVGECCCTSHTCTNFWVFICRRLDSTSGSMRKSYQIPWVTVAMPLQGSYGVLPLYQMLFEDSTVLKFSFNGTIWDIVPEGGWFFVIAWISLTNLLLSLCAPHSVANRGHAYFSDF